MSARIDAYVISNATLAVLERPLVIHGGNPGSSEHQGERLPG